MGVLTLPVGEDQTLCSGVPPAVSAVHGERVQEADFLEAREGVGEVVLAAALHVREIISGPYWKRPALELGCAPQNIPRSSS